MAHVVLDEVGYSLFVYRVKYNTATNFGKGKEKLKISTKVQIGA